MTSDAYIETWTPARTLLCLAVKARRSEGDHATLRIIATVKTLGATDAWNERRAQALPCDGDAVAWRVRASDRLNTAAPIDHRADGRAT